jgi:organic hydroperoxide reductase OsmC/OhrA
MSTATETSAVRAREFHFPLTVDWLGERRVGASVEGKPTIEITPTPVFRGTDPTTWSPEDFLVAAAASCLAVTFTSLRPRLASTTASSRSTRMVSAAAVTTAASALPGSNSPSRSKPMTPPKHAASPSRRRRNALSPPRLTCPSRP